MATYWKELGFSWSQTVARSDGACTLSQCNGFSLGFDPSISSESHLSDEAVSELLFFSLCGVVLGLGVLESCFSNFAVFGTKMKGIAGLSLRTGGSCGSGCNGRGGSGGFLIGGMIAGRTSGDEAERRDLGEMSLAACRTQCPGSLRRMTSSPAGNLWEAAAACSTAGVAEAPGSAYTDRIFSRSLTSGTATRSPSCCSHSPELAAPPFQCTEKSPAAAFLIPRRFSGNCHPHPPASGCPPGVSGGACRCKTPTRKTFPA
nr:hypothetical protein Iba_chr11eCG6300 [Ipomoea batatas]